MTDIARDIAQDISRDFGSDNLILKARPYLTWASSYGVGLNAQNVARWDDKIRKRRASQGTPANQPPYTYPDTSFNKLATVDAASGDLLVDEGSQTDLRFLHDGTGMSGIASVAMPAATNAAVFGTGTTATSGTGVVVWYTTGNAFKLTIGNGGGVSFSINLTTAAVGTPFRGWVAFSYSSAAGGAIYLSGGYSATQAELSAPASGDPSGTMSLHANGAGGLTGGSKIHTLALFNKHLPEATLRAMGASLAREAGYAA